MNESNEIIIDIMPTVFPQMNASQNLPSDHKISKLNVKRLKHGHLRHIQKMKDADQIHFLMAELTGLSQNDVDELDVEDSAKLSEVIFSFMKRYAEMAKEMSR